MKSVSYISIASVQKCRPVVTDPRSLPPSFAPRYYVVSHGGAGELASSHNAIPRRNFIRK